MGKNIGKKRTVTIIQSQNRREKGIVESITQLVAAGYVYAMIIIFPLFYLNKYYNMGNAKLTFFKYVNIVLLPCLLALAIICFILAVKSESLLKVLRRLSLTDCFVIAYAVLVLLSYLFSSYKNTALFGSGGWNMGLLSQLGFVCIYFVVSRFFEIKPFFIYTFLIVTAVIFLLGVLNRFGIDPLNMYDSPQIDRSFLSTLGQPTWYSSFLCTVFPFGLFLFWNNETLREDILLGIYTFIGFATMVTQNSDSAYIGFFVMMVALFCYSFRSNQKFMKFLEICVIAFTAFKLMGLLQILFPKQAFKNETLSVFVAQSKATLILFILIIIVYAMFLYLDKNNKLNITKYKKVPKIVVGCLLVFFAAAVVLVCCVTSGNIPDSLQSLKNNNYLYFNNRWGNSRGINWKYTCKLIWQSGPITKLFGCGPDCYQPYMYEKYGIEMNAYWGSNAVVCCAHNEWLNSLLTVGLFGFIAYVGIFVSQIVRCIKKSVKEPYLVAVVLCALCYMGHNIFCYQQIICTPMIFILMGIGEYIMRESRTRD